MPRKATELSALAVSRLTDPGLHFVGGVPGLALQVASPDARSWILRIAVGGRRREMGLGGFPEISLASAREKARDARDLIRKGVDPVDQKKAARSALRAAATAARTFKQCAEEYMSVHAAGWKNAKHGQQWRSTLETYAYPKIGNLLIGDVEKAHILDVLKPIWTEKNETAARLRGRIELVISYAMQAEYRAEGLNPARWRGGLDKLLLSKEKAVKRKHFTALPVRDLGSFMERLRKTDGMGARALEFVILTAARSGEVRGATWAEIDLDAGIWTVPADRMKAGKEHRVPLSGAALALLRALPKFAGVDLVFPSPRSGSLSDMTLTSVLRRMGLDAVPHGFRSTFRDWCAEQTNFPREVAEMSLAHTIGDKVEAAYRRGDLFEKRRRLMEEWAGFCAAPAPAGEVIQINERGKMATS